MALRNFYFSLPSCLISSLLLATTAGWVVESLYLGTAIMGFSISMQVASGNSPSLLAHFLPGFAWLADQVDMTGFRNSVVFLGGNSGWLIFPPVAGIIIFSGPGGVGVYLLSLGAKFISKNLSLSSIQVFVWLSFSWWASC